MTHINPTPETTRDYSLERLIPSARRVREDCVACDGTGQCAMSYDGVVALETCDICGGSGVAR